MTSWSLSISSRARFRPTLPRADDDDVHGRASGGLGSSARSNISIATLVGEIVCRPCSAYQVARAGSITRTITCSTPKRRCTIWAIVRFVLSPSVEAMNTSARSIPASSSASISSAVPTVNGPPASSQLRLWPASSRSCESGSSSSTDTSCPAASADLASADPTRPAPTISTNMGRTGSSTGAHASTIGHLGARARCRVAAGAVRITRQAALLDDVLGHVSDEVFQPARRVRRAARRRASRDGSSAASTIASTPRRRASSTIASPGAPRAHGRGRDLDALYSSPTAFARASAGARALELRLGQARVERQRHRHAKIHTASIVACSIAASSVGSPPTSRAAVWTMSSSSVVADQRHEDRAVVASRSAARRAAPLGHRHARARASLLLARAVDHVEGDPDHHPGEADVARAGVQRRSP